MVWISHWFEYPFKRRTQTKQAKDVIGSLDGIACQYRVHTVAHLTRLLDAVSYMVYI